MRARKLLSARNCNCFTAPSVLQICFATSLMLFCSTNLRTTTFFCSAGNVSTKRKQRRPALDFFDFLGTYLRCFDLRFV